jgi:hypothetical protein
MNDQEIKNILKNDHQIPIAPIDEWDSIRKKLAQKNKFFLPLSWPKGALAGAMICAFIAITFFQNGYQINSSSNRDEIYQYFFNESYFSEDVDPYFWLDSDP